MRFPFPRRGAALVPTLAVLAALGLAACGSGSSSSSASAGSTTPQGGARGGGFFGAAQDPKVVACLKKQGVTLPTGRFQRGNGSGQPATGTTPSGAPPTSTTPNGPRRNFRGNSAQFQKLRPALQKCGVKLPTGPPGGGGAAPPAGTGTGAS